MTDHRNDLERLIRAGFDQQAVSYAAGLMKTFMAPNQPQGDKRLHDGLHKLADHYRRANEVLDAALEKRDT